MKNNITYIRHFVFYGEIAEGLSKMGFKHPMFSFLWDRAAIDPFEVAKL